MAAEVRMVLYEDDAVQVQYVDGSRLQLSPCGSEFVFEKAPPVSAHPLEQPERIRQRTHFVISTYREQLQRALDFRNSFATCPFLSENIIPSERKKHVFLDILEVRWPSLDTDDGTAWLQGGTVKVASLDGHAYLCLPASQHEFTVHFLCKVSQKPDSSIVLSEKNSQAKKDKLVEKAGKTLTCGNLPGQRLKNKDNELHCQIMKSRGPSEKERCVNGNEGKEALPAPGPKHTCVHAWVEQRWSVASCPEEWKYPLSLALRFHDKIRSLSGTDVTVTQNATLTSDVSEGRGKAVSLLPRALSLSCPGPHLHRSSLSLVDCKGVLFIKGYHGKALGWLGTNLSPPLRGEEPDGARLVIRTFGSNAMIRIIANPRHSLCARWSFRDSLSPGRSDEEEHAYPEPVKVLWFQGVTYRLTHKNVNSIEIYPGDGSVFKSEGAYFGNFFTYYSTREGSEEREEKMYSVNNLPPDRPGSLFSVRSLIKQATRVLQHCAKMRLSLSHDYYICCWKMVPGINDNNILPLLLKESFIPSVGRFLAYSDDKVHVIFLDGVTLTLNWNFASFIEKSQVNQGLSLGWCKLTFPDGHDQLIQIEHSGPYERYISAVISWCRKLTQTSQRETLINPSFSVPEENWCVASELEKIQKFNSSLEKSDVLNRMSNKRNEQSSEYKPEHSGTLLEEVNEKTVSVALKKISEVIQDIDCLLSNSIK